VYVRGGEIQITKLNNRSLGVFCIIQACVPLQNSGFCIIELQYCWSRKREWAVLYLIQLKTERPTDAGK
jgi:hypothetical protein